MRRSRMARESSRKRSGSSRSTAEQLGDLVQPIHEARPVKRRPRGRSHLIPAVLEEDLQTCEAALDPPPRVPASARRTRPSSHRVGSARGAARLRDPRTGPAPAYRRAWPSYTRSSLPIETAERPRVRAMPRRRRSEGADVGCVGKTSRRETAFSIGRQGSDPGSTRMRSSLPSDIAPTTCGSSSNDRLTRALTTSRRSRV